MWGFGGSVLLGEQSELFHADIAEEDFHGAVAVELESDGAFVAEGDAGVVDHGLLVQEGLDALAGESDAEVVPFSDFIDGLYLVRFAGVAALFIFRGIDAGGHIDLEAAGDTDLDLVTVAPEEDAGVVVLCQRLEFQFQFIIFVGGGGPEVGSRAAIIFDEDGVVLDLPAFCREAGGAYFPSVE